jgi:hypothetical protein
VDLELLVGKYINTMFGRKFGSIDFLYQHLFIDSTIPMHQIDWLPPIWTTITATMCPDIFPILFEYMNRWPKDAQCNIHYISKETSGNMHFVNHIHIKSYNGIQFRVTKIHPAHKTDSNKLDSRFEIENKIKSMKICGLKQKPTTVRVKCNRNTILKLKSCALDLIRDNNNCYDLSGFFIERGGQKWLNDSVYARFSITIEFDELLATDGYLSIEEYPNNHDCHEKMDDDYLYITQVDRMFKKSNQPTDISLTGVVKYMLLEFVDRGDHLDKFVMDINFYGYLFHLDFDQIEKRNYQDDGCYYVITMPVDRNYSISSYMEDTSKRYGWPLHGCNFGCETIATALTKNNVVVDYHLFVFVHSIIRFAQGYVNQLLVHY